STRYSDFTKRGEGGIIRGLMDASESKAGNLSRRRFVIRGLAAGVALAVAPRLARAANAEQVVPRSQVTIRKDAVVLFQGDSITDAGRSRETASTPNQQA